MDFEGEGVTISLLSALSETQSRTITLSEYETVECLKLHIFSIFNIPPDRQLIGGWKVEPENEQNILQACCHVNRVNVLLVEEITMEEHMEDSLELEAVGSCLTEFSKLTSTACVKFNKITLKCAIEQNLLVPIDQRKVILLDLHNSANKFSTHILRMINCNEEINQKLRRSFFLVGWDIQNNKYHDSLHNALNDVGLQHIYFYIESKMSAVILIQNVHGSINISGILTEGITESEVLCYLNNSYDFLSYGNEDEKPEEAKSFQLDSKAFQKLMADSLGDRDYDCFAFNQHKYLKDKIGYALFGPPQKETGYDGEEIEKINVIYSVVSKNNEQFTEYKDQVEICYIFNCTEPLPDEKLSRKKKYPNYNPATDITPVPIFVLRKCRDSKNPCRIFIDDIGRKYENWSNYIEDNKLYKCIMVLPQDGRYKVENNQVLLQRHFSPACSLGKTLLQVGDVTSAIASVGSGGVMLAGATSLAVAPAALAAASLVGIGAGIYSMVRAAGHLADRREHDETLSLKNSEARGLYFGLVAGSLGFVGAGANAAVSQFAARGFNIGKGVGAVVNTIGVANIGVSGASIVNSSYDVFDQWHNQRQPPSLLTIVQLSSSILFFGSAVYNFKTCQTVIDETQAKVLQDYSESLRSNRHRRTFNKLSKETVRQNNGDLAKGRAEVIKSIRNIPNKDEVFAVLTRNNKIMNENGVRFSASGGEITLNGHKISMSNFGTLNKQEASSFLSNLPVRTDISPAETASVVRNFSANGLTVPNAQSFAIYGLQLVGTFGTNIQGMFFQILQDLIPILRRIFSKLIKEIFPAGSVATKAVDILLEYFAAKAVNYLKNFGKWQNTGSREYYDKDFSCMPKDKAERYKWIFEKLVRLCFNKGNVIEHELKEIIRFAEEYIVSEYFEYSCRQEEIRARMLHSPIPSRKIRCSICSGYYFKNA